MHFSITSEWSLHTCEATRNAFEDGSFNARDQQVYIKHIQGHFIRHLVYGGWNH